MAAASCRVPWPYLSLSPSLPADPLMLLGPGTVRAKAAFACETVVVQNTKTSTHHSCLVLLQGQLMPAFAPSEERSYQTGCHLQDDTDILRS